MTVKDVRWKQRFNHYHNAFHELKESIVLANTRPLSKLEKQGVIQGFEYTFELAWNLLKDYLTFQGHTRLVGSRDTIREAFKRELIMNGEVWMEMIKSRNLVAHAYDREIAEQIYTDIFSLFFSELEMLYVNFLQRSREEEN
ncbi:nucleotidyltransferase substrate binding protein [Thiospirillum jenense]|uniref:Nucleotidyltransferase substrate binding protein n=1 Tax=Thiospirillum jenense TaxID=1653858 RepID=A0A839HJZ3_9GAMM|nr:nucleotidyltransferase substrate binding protein [Thiospirillum jenense]MBB1127216.1 nucleotidyltransferase substrate binding protein [Thiospirillum jenense]